MIDAYNAADESNREGHVIGSHVGNNLPDYLFNKPAKQYRVWFVAGFGSGFDFKYPVSSPAEGAKILDAIAKFALTDWLQETIYTSAGGLEVYDPKYDEWEKWEDENGNDIDDYDPITFKLIEGENGQV